MSTIEVRTEEFKREAAKLLGPDTKQIVLEMRRGLRGAAKPVGERILTAIADAMPKSGGLAARVASRGRVSVLLDLKRGVRIQLANRDGMYMEQFEDTGSIRHPIPWIPHRGQPQDVHPWRPKKVPKGAGQTQFEKEADGLQRMAANAVDQAVRKLIT